MRWRVERYEKEKAGRLELVYLEEVFGAKKKSGRYTVNSTRRTVEQLSRLNRDAKERIVEALRTLAPVTPMGQTPLN